MLIYLIFFLECEKKLHEFEFFLTLFFSDPVGGLKYSIKMLSREEKQTNEYTNANGRTIYGRCETPCTTEPIPEDLDESESKL